MSNHWTESSGGDRYSGAKSSSACRSQAPRHYVLPRNAKVLVITVGYLSARNLLAQVEFRADAQGALSCTILTWGCLPSHITPRDWKRSTFGAISSESTKIWWDEIGTLRRFSNITANASQSHLRDWAARRVQIERDACKARLRAHLKHEWTFRLANWGKKAIKATHKLSNTRTNGLSQRIS